MPAPGFRKQDASYETVHARLFYERGRAADYACDECGDQAKDWAYDNLDANAMFDEKGRPYSEDLSHYKPMCRTCHRRMDAKNVCRRGHELTEANIYKRGNRRYCRRCRRDNMREFRAREASQ